MRRHDSRHILAVPLTQSAAAALQSLRVQSLPSRLQFEIAASQRSHKRIPILNEERKKWSAGTLGSPRHPHPDMPKLRVAYCSGRISSPPSKDAAKVTVCRDPRGVVGGNPPPKAESIVERPGEASSAGQPRSSTSGSGVVRGLDGSGAGAGAGAMCDARRCMEEYAAFAARTRSAAEVGKDAPPCACAGDAEREDAGPWDE